MKARDLLIALSLKCKGDWDAVMDMIQKRKAPTNEEIEDAIKNPRDAITIVDKDYPRYFQSCHKPPMVIFYKGDRRLIHDGENILAYIGSRDASRYGLRLAEEICSGVSKEGFTVVSGMARGIDGAALRAAIKEKGRAIAFLGSGIDRPFPESNKDLYEELCRSGLVLSEYPDDTPPKASNFPFRNRMIAACCRALIVGEGKLRSGTSSTVAYALGVNAEIGAVPFLADEETLNNQLIKDGAALITCAQDAIDLMGPRARRKENRNSL